MEAYYQQQSVSTYFAGHYRQRGSGSKSGRMRKLKTNREKPKQIIRKKKPLTRSRSNFFSKAQNDY